MTYSFEKLEIWKLSISLSFKIYGKTINFPAIEKFGISNQLRRSISSVPANIAEGSSRLGNKDRAHFYQIAFSSLMEVLNFLILSEKLEYIKSSEFNDLRLDLDELANKINAYYKKIPV